MPIFLIALSLVGCERVPSPAVPVAMTTMTTITPFHTEVRPTQTEPVIRPTLTPTLVLPGATPSVVPTLTATPTPAPTSVLKEENGWVTYRNEIVGYEISAPNNYQIKGFYPEMGWIGPSLLGPAVPDEEIAKLLARYYGKSLSIFMGEPDPSGQVKS